MPRVPRVLRVPRVPRVHVRAGLTAGRNWFMSSAPSWQRHHTRSPTRPLGECTWRPLGVCHLWNVPNPSRPSPILFSNSELDTLDSWRVLRLRFRSVLLLRLLFGMFHYVSFMPFHSLVFLRSILSFDIFNRMQKAVEILRTGIEVWVVAGCDRKGLCNSWGTIKSQESSKNSKMQWQGENWWQSVTWACKKNVSEL